MTGLDHGFASAEDKYDQMMALADLFDATGAELRARARLGSVILSDEDVTASAELSPRTWEAFETELRGATSGRLGLQTRSVELDADAFVVRATVLTYRWIDELQEAAYRTLGSIAGRAIGYLAPQVALGGAIVSAGLIETDSLDRDDVASYLNDLAENNPDLMDHLTTGGGGLLESLQMRSLLTASVLSGDDGAAAGRGGLRAAGVDLLPQVAASAFRDAAAAFEPAETELPHGSEAAGEAPTGIEDLLRRLEQTRHSVAVERLPSGRFIAYLPGPHVGIGRLRLVTGDHRAYATEIIEALEHMIGDEPDARVMLVGSAQGGVAAAQIAADTAGEPFIVEQVVTAGSPSSQVPRIPEETQVLSLEDRADPVALLGSLINAGVDNRLTVVFDGADARDGVYVTGGRIVDRSGHPELRAAVGRLRRLGYLA
ncbi:MAG: hypothetical protein U0R78_10655 [Nocardioidaceae bacterium]